MWFGEPFDDSFCDNLCIVAQNLRIFATFEMRANAVGMEQEHVTIVHAKRFDMRD